MTRKDAQPWRVLSKQQRNAAALLLEHKVPRASVGRWYDAAYSLLTAEVMEAGVQDFGRLKNPSYEALPELVLNRVTRVSVRSRNELSKAIKRLSKLRVQADYKPGEWVDEPHANLARVQMTLIERHLNQDTKVRTS